MPKALHNRIRRLVQLFDAGTLNEIEFALEIAACTERPDFTMHLDHIPADLMQRLRTIAEEAPAHPEDCLIIGSVYGEPGFDYEAWNRAHREAVYWSGRRLREFFYPDRPLPEFQPLKLIGVVADTLELDGAVVIIGEFKSMFIRRHPMQLALPDSRTISTAASEIGVFKSRHDTESDDPAVREWGRRGIKLGGNVTSTSDVPARTEVWVDRSAAQQLPKPPWT